MHSTSLGASEPGSQQSRKKVTTSGLVGLEFEIKDIKIAAYPFGKRQRAGAAYI